MKIKNIIFVVLLLPSVCCFAVSQKLVDSAENYKTALWNLQKIVKDLDIANKDYKYWMQELAEIDAAPNKTDVMRKIHQNEVDKSSKRVNGLNAEYAAAQNTLKQYEPLKIEYDKQVAWEHKMSNIKDAVLSGIMLSLGGSIFALIFWYGYRRYRKYEQLFKEGKITKEEFDRFMHAARTKSMFDDDRYNPATGLRMGGGCDSAGNGYGSSSSSSFTTQSYSSHHRYD